MIKKLNEDTSLKFKNISPEEKAKKGILGRLYGPVASFAAPTRNGRHYSQDLWEKLFNSDLIKERFANGGIFGELCHPDYEEVDMSKVAVIMPEPPVKDDKGQLITYIDILDTPCGKIAYQLAKYGYKFGISSRGTGDIIEDWEGNEEVDPDTYQLNAFDLVEIPAECLIAISSLIYAAIALKYLYLVIEHSSFLLVKIFWNNGNIQSAF